MSLKNFIPQIGHSVPRADAFEKVTGREKYAADHYGDDLLWCAAKRADVGHGRILSIKTEQACRHPGVHMVLTAKDVPGPNRQGIVVKDQPVLADDKVRHFGDAVALILAENRSVLKEALALIEVAYEPLPVLFDMENALDPCAPFIHEDNPTGNLYADNTICCGDIEKAFPECDVVVEADFEVPIQAHGFLETENGIAHVDENGCLVMTVSTQAPFRDRLEISHALNMPLNNIRIINPYLGGGFGGKDGATVQCLLALAAINAGRRPVKMWWDREESFVAGYKRHAVRMHYELGAKNDGTLHALSCRLDYDTGAYAHLGGEVMLAGIEHAGGPYRIPNTKIQGRCIYTNNPIGGAMRGFGATQAAFAMESMMAMLAERLAIDPLELRLKNALQRGDRNATGATVITSTGIVDCIKVMQNHPLWKERRSWKAAAGRHKTRGVGVAACLQAMGYGWGMPDNAIAKIELTRRGTFKVYNGVSDMGQGNAGTFLQIAGETLCQRFCDLELEQPDTERTLPSGSSSASRTTFTYGNALIRACKSMRKKLINRAALMMFITDDESGFELLPGGVRHLPTQKEISLKRLAQVMNDQDRICINEYRARVSKEPFDGSIAVKFGFPHMIFSYAVHLARIEVDKLTGRIDVWDYLAITDAGRIINPQVYEQQVQGAVAQGLGYALFEDFIVRQGKVETRDFTTYIIPTAIDVPDIVSLAVQTIEYEGPYGMKGVGEVGMLLPLPAVAGGVRDACGCFVLRPPLTGERIIALINGKERQSHEA